MRTLVTLSCLAVSAGIAGAQSSVVSFGPCTLLTKAEVQEAVGVPVAAGVVNTTNRTVCDFKIEGGASTLSIMLTHRTPADSAARTVAELKKAKINAEVTAGFGDSAYSTSPGYGMQQLGVYKGSSHVIVTVLLFGTPEAKAKAIAQAVMRKALPRVP